MGAGNNKAKPKGDREARLKAALKANLGRRKAADKARAESQSPESTKPEAGQEQDRNG